LDLQKENDHLQSTGRDLKNRKQYIYHPAWTAYNQQSKFNKLLKFGQNLGKLRAQIEIDLSEKEWNKEKVLALIIHLLDDYFLRIGNQYYTDNNESYGITTLRRKHIAESKELLSLEYQAKSNKVRKITIENKKLAKLVREISELPGYEIFRYKDGIREWHNIESEDVNNYIERYMGAEFSAKDFRTWGGTKLVIELLDEAQLAVKENNRLQFEPTLVRMVAKKLGNTLSTCSAYYVHPKVLAAANSQQIPAHTTSKYTLKNLSIVERKVLQIIDA
jgi:DNA topoisomerase-1